MKRKEIAVYRQRLREILNIKDEDKRLGELKQLAKDVGAGYEHNEIVAATVVTTQTGSGTLHETRTHGNSISESELVLNINNALQTEMMIDMCKISARNYRIAFVAVIIAALSALAAWSPIVAVNRYALSATTEGGMYILDTRTGQTWLRAASTEYDLGTTNKPIFKLVEYKEPPPEILSNEEMGIYTTKEDPNN